MPEVQTIHILNSGEILKGDKQLNPHKELFAWVKQDMIVQKHLELRSQTEDGRKSVIAIIKMVKLFLIQMLIRVLLHETLNRITFIRNVGDLRDNGS